MKIMIAGAVQKKYRRQLFPLLKPFQKTEDFTDAHRQLLYHISESEVVFVEHIEECDFVVLPMSWNFYIQKGLIKEVTEYIIKAKEYQKTVLSYMRGDYGIKVPEYDHVLVFRASGHRSRLSPSHLGMPPFIDDPLRKIYESEQIDVQPYKERPIIGFCGMANFSKKYALEELTRIITRNMRFRLGNSKNLPQQVIPTTYRRAQLLKTCMDDEAIETNFIFRKKYFGGALTDAQKQKTTKEFYDNLRDSQYVLCFRGAGNFSVRFYEALAMGRIPVFINTDCLVPLEDTLRWKQHVVWIEYKERHRIADKIKEFHQNMDAAQFIHLQKENRKLWEKKLTLGGFFKAQLINS